MAGRFLLSYLGALSWLQPAGRIGGHCDSGASLSSGLSFILGFLGHGSLRATFQEGVGKSVICITVLVKRVTSALRIGGLRS